MIQNPHYAAAIAVQKNRNNRYIVGDLHGCLPELEMLLDKIAFDLTSDFLYFCGDLVARGNHSLATLRLVKTLAEQGAAKTVLGNHDITLIANWLGVLPCNEKDKTAQILNAPDADELLNWLRAQPFLLSVVDGARVGKRLDDDVNLALLAHAGLPPIWHESTAWQAAAALQSVFAGDLRTLAAFIPNLYDGKPRRWQESGDLAGAKDRLVLAADYFTRMRLCRRDSTLEFSYKGGGKSLPIGYLPWFEWQNLLDKRIYFGHWAALLGKIDTPRARALDGGCVWGKQLLAQRLNDGRLFAVKAQKKEIR